MDQRKCIIKHSNQHGAFFVNALFSTSAFYYYYSLERIGALSKCNREVQALRLGCVQVFLTMLMPSGGRDSELPAPQ